MSTPSSLLLPMQTADLKLQQVSEGRWQVISIDQHCYPMLLLFAHNSPR